MLLLIGISGCQNLVGFGSWGLGQQESKPLLETVESHRFLLGSDTQIVGELVSVYSRGTDTLPDIGRHFGLGFNDIIDANSEIDIWLPKAGSRVVLPLQFVLPDAERNGIVLNLPNMRLFHFVRTADGRNVEVLTYPVGIGREGWSTPVGKSRIVEKRANPTWTVPESIRREHAADGDPLPRVVKAGPENPLGQYAMRLSLPSYLIHGTNKPYGVGMRISHGCVRLYPENIEPLFKSVKVGTPVNIVNQPYLLGWRGGMLYLEAHKPLETRAADLKALRTELDQKIAEAIGKTQASVDLDKIDKILRQANGIPTPILEHSPRLRRLLKEATVIRHPRSFYGAPQTPPLQAGNWSAVAGTFRSKSDAEKLARVLQHQGPSIPSRVHAAGGGYQVILGPFMSEKEADLTRRRLSREFALDISLIRPTL